VSQGKYIKDMLKKFDIEDTMGVVYLWGQMEAWIVIVDGSYLPY
jgi:hypothetical protein